MKFCQTSDDIQRHVTGQVTGKVPFKAYTTYVYVKEEDKFEKTSDVPGDSARCAEINEKYKLWTPVDGEIRTSLWYYSQIEIIPSSLPEGPRIPYSKRVYIVPYAEVPARTRLRDGDDTVYTALCTIDVISRSRHCKVWYLLMTYSSDGTRVGIPLGESLLYIHGLSSIPSKKRRADSKFTFDREDKKDRLKQHGRHSGAEAAAGAEPPSDHMRHVDKQPVRSPAHA